MTITSNPPVLFSDNAGQVTYSLSDSEVIYVVIGGKSYLLPVAAATGTLELSDILRAAPVGKPPRLTMLSTNNRVTITAGPADLSDSTGRASVNVRALVGGMYGKTAAEAFTATQKSWLTLNAGSDSNPRKTAKWGKELLVFLPYAGDTGGSIRFNVYIPGHILPTITLDDWGAIGWDPSVPITTDAGYARVLSALKQAYPDFDLEDRITGWAVYFQGADASYVSKGAVFSPMRTKSNYREFVYRNSLGCWDTVYSKGAFKVVPEYSFTSFINRNTEGQLGSQAVEHMEVGSGPLETAVEQRMWLEMIASDEVYMVDQSGDMRLVIIDESSPSLQQKELNSLTVKCHYADRAVGNGTRISIA